LNITGGRVELSKAPHHEQDKRRVEHQKKNETSSRKTTPVAEPAKTAEFTAEVDVVTLVQEMLHTWFLRR